jgi:hypothetical protein
VAEFSAALVCPFFRPISVGRHLNLNDDFGLATAMAEGELAISS